MLRPGALATLVLLGMSSACASPSARPALDASSQADAPSVFDLATGRWDQARGDSTCLGNQHAITFSADRTQMVLTFDQPLDSVSKDPNVRYRVLASGEGIHEELSYVIRASMAGESRTTASGELVIWDLIMATPNRYHWHRTDWPGVGITNAVIRCDGMRPLEDWTPPGQQSPDNRPRA